MGQHEYTSSRRLFIDFLRGVSPFAGVFTQALAEDFYASVRCGLLHEATTKNRWRIHAKGSAAIDPADRIVFRDQLQALILSYVEGFGEMLRHDPERQSAFLRKFDRLADEAV